MPSPYRPEGYPERECAHCGTAFRPSWPKLIYCSPGCRDARRKKRDRQRCRTVPVANEPPDWPYMRGEIDFRNGFAAHDLGDDPERGIYLKLRPEPNRTLGGVAG